MLDIEYAEQPKEAPIAYARIKSEVDKDWGGYVKVERDSGNYKIYLTVSNNQDKASYFLDETAAKDLVDVINNILNTEA